MIEIAAKKLSILPLLIITFLFLLPKTNYSQNNLCAQADPFCTGTTYTYPAGVNAGTAESGPSYSCLGSEPNPAWYYLQIANSGNLEISMVGGNSTNDIDFCCWGPFPNLAAACGGLTGGVGGSSHHATGAGGGYPSGNVVDCSYDVSPQEWCYIPNAVTGQVYMLMITNYSNSACNIIFSQDSGPGTTDCSIVAPPISNNGPLCEGQTLNLTVNNPTAGATYSWTGPNGFTSTTMNPSIPNVTTANAGTYSLTISLNGQTSQPVTTTVVINTNPIANAGTPQSICSGATATLTASGGTTYVWNTGGTTATITDAPAATTTYTVTATSNGCTGTSDVVVTVNPAPTAVVSSTPASCGLNNGTATVTGGTSCVWSNSQTTSTITGLAGGTYTVTITDANGCTATGSCTVGNTPGGSVTLTETDENCGQANGTATATVNGGTTPIQYIWSNTQTSQTITSLPAGVYTVSTTDATGCTASGSVTVNNIPGPSLQVVTVTNETCSYGNGNATVNAVGGVAPFTYVWSNSATGATASNLHAGTYGVTVTDANNCTAMNSVTLTNAPPPTAAASATPADCGQANGTASVIANGGLSPYTYLWSSACTASTATNLQSGNYTVTVTDAAGCTVSAQVTVGLVNVVTATISSTPEYCNQSNGTIITTAVGGSGIYSYTWSNGQSTQSLTNLHAGAYSVTISDGFCTVIESITVGEVQGPVASFSVHPRVLTLMDGPVSFNDNSVGTVTQWNWDFGDNSPHGSGPDPQHVYQNLGEYYITEIVSDNNGCSDTITDSVKIKEIYTIYVPSAFTPNGDGVNDIFLPKGINIDPDNYELMVFDRWGKLVFRTSNLLEGWDGTLNNKGDANHVVLDVYVYRIKLKEIDGPKHDYIGRVTLVP